MAKLTAKGRSSISTSQFGIPSKAKTAGAKKKSGNFPIPDQAHARSALSLLHNASPADQKKIRSKANAMLGKKSK